MVLKGARFDNKGKVFFCSKTQLEAGDIVEPDPKNEGLIQKQHRDLTKDSIKELDARKIGFIVASKVNGEKFGCGFVYEVDTNLNV